MRRAFARQPQIVAFGLLIRKQFFNQTKFGPGGSGLFGNVVRIIRSGQDSVNFVRSAEFVVDKVLASRSFQGREDLALVAQ